MRRRTILTTTVTVGGVGMSGCLGSAMTNLLSGGHIEPDGEPPNVPADFECDADDLHRLYEDVYEPANASLGESGGFGLRINKTAFTVGERARITLRNTTFENQSTGNRDKIGILLYTEEGWTEVRAALPGTPGPDDDAPIHRPGEGFEWEFELSESGIRDAGANLDGVEVCPELREGRYQFVFWGLHDPVAVKFDLMED